MTTNPPLDFYFDFSSPYGYLAGHGIDPIAEKHGRTVMWRPYLLGVVFAITGQSPLTTQPLRGDYALHDLTRSARSLRVPFVMPEPFPVLTLAAGRAYYWIHDRDPAMAKAFARSVYHRIFGEGGDIATPAAIIAIAEACGADGGNLRRRPGGYDPKFRPAPPRDTMGRSQYCGAAPVNSHLARR